MVAQKTIFYLISNKRAVEIGINYFNNFYADLIDFESHKKISTESETTFDKLVSEITERGWFNEMDIVPFYRLIDNARSILTIN